MVNQFTAKEVKDAIKSLKNNKSPSIDELRAEQLKYGPEEVHNEIAEQLNEIKKTGEAPREITLGILTPLAKPGKKQGPCENLRPIILLSILRKIISICLIRRIGERVQSKIPKSQSAYQKGRSTTEQVFVFRTMAEKAIASNNYHTHLLMMDMSKAFDTVNRSTLMKDLVLILEPDELHLIIKILVTEVQLVVKCGKTLGKCFQTNTGVPQGDCLSPILFILYFANALQEEPVYEQPNKVAKTGKHVYIAPTKILIEAQHADDISWLTNGDYTIIEGIRVKAKTQLEKRGLIINTEKTEEHEISYKPPERRLELAALQISGKSG